MKQNKMGRQKPKGKTNRKRKDRTMERLVSMCEVLGDKSDKSGILARWQKYLNNPEWRDVIDLRWRDRIRELVTKLEKHSRDLNTQGGASGKGRDIARERFWEASPLTSVENTLEEEIPVPEWTPLQVESWALYLESQILFASIDIRISVCTGQFPKLQSQDKAEMDILMQAHGVSVIDFAPDTGESDNGYSDPEGFSELLGYSLAADVTIPISRFTSRMCIELERMSQVPYGKARAFQLAFMFRLEFLRFEKMGTVWWREGLYKTDALLLVLLSQEQNDRYPEHPLDCAHAFLFLTTYIIQDNRRAFFVLPDQTAIENLHRHLGYRILHHLKSVLDEILSLVVRDLRREYRRDLYLAFGQRLPADIYEGILDWVEAAHDIPETVEEYAMGLCRSTNALNLEMKMG